MNAPSTAWQERVQADEAARFEGYVRQFQAMQQAKSARLGPGRALHRKQIMGLAARLQVLPDLPEAARHGLFATPGEHPVWVRLSNGSADRAADRVPDIRGLGVRVFGVHGPSALGNGPATHQDFALINHPAFAFATSAPFMGLVMSAAKGPLAVPAHFIRRHGVLGGLREMRKLLATLGKPFLGFASEAFHSAAPIACGPYAARVRLLPAAAQRTARNGRGDWAADVAQRLRVDDLHWTLQLQFFVDEARTPIEDASVDWPEAVAPYVDVARLVVPAQRLDGEAALAFQRQVEQGSFDPWSALAAHRPLGEVMRARKAVYFASQQGRGAA